MSDSIRQFNVGEAQISVINIGDIYLPLVKNMNTPEAELKVRSDIDDFLQQENMPIHSFVIALPQTTVLVDAGIYDTVNYPEYAIKDYTAPPSLIEQLNSLNIPPESIDHVIITHRHWDHFNGTTVEKDGNYVPQFPEARYYIGLADRERSAEARQDESSIEYRTLRILDNHGVLEKVEGDFDLLPEIRIIHAPGETRGHQIVRLDSKDETFFCVGDLYNVPLEILEPELMVTWARPETMVRSRDRLTRAALASNALIAATHMPEIGRIKKSASGLIWETLY